MGNPFKSKKSPPPQALAPSTSSVVENVPRWVQKESEELYNKAKNTTGKDPENRVFQGERIAPLHQMQLDAMKLARGTTGKYEPEASEVSNIYRQNAAYKPKDVTTNRFTGPESDPIFEAYFNKMYAPRSEELNREAQRGMTQARAQTAFGGKALGSQRALQQAALEEGRLNGLRGLQGDVFGQAMSAFQSEEARLLEAAKVNQAAGLQNKGLDIQNASGMMQNILNKYNMDAQDIGRLFGLGESAREHDQEQINASIQKFQEMNNYDRMELEFLSNYLAANSGGALHSVTNVPIPKQSSLGEGLGFTALQMAPQIFK